jgi:hypothetical protein
VVISESPIWNDWILQDELSAVANRCQYPDEDFLKSVAIVQRYRQAAILPQNLSTPADSSTLCTDSTYIGNSKHMAPHNSDN